MAAHMTSTYHDTVMDSLPVASGGPANARCTCSGACPFTCPTTNNVNSEATLIVLDDR